MKNSCEAAVAVLSCFWTGDCGLRLFSFGFRWGEVGCVVCWCGRCEMVDNLALDWVIAGFVEL